MQRPSRAARIGRDGGGDFLLSGWLVSLLLGIVAVRLFLYSCSFCAMPPKQLLPFWTGRVEGEDRPRVSIYKDDGSRNKKREKQVVEWEDESRNALLFFFTI